MIAAAGLGLSAAATWFLRTVSTRVQRRFRDKVTIALEVARRDAAGVGADDRASGAARLSRSPSVLRNQVFMLDHMYMSLFSTCGWILRLGVTIVLLDVDSSGAGRCSRSSRCRRCRPRRGGQAVERAAQERGAPSSRLARHLFDVATTAAPGKEVRITGIGERLVDATAAGVGARLRADRARRAGRRRRGTRWPGRSSAAAYVGAVVFVSSGLSAPAGDVLLVLAAGARLSVVCRRHRRRDRIPAGFWMDSARRLAWLEDYAAAVAATADQPVARAPR